MRMNAKPFFDTNVLVYALAHDERRTPVAEALLDNGGVISVQVLNELVAVGRRKLGKEWSEIEEALGAIRALCDRALPVTIETHEAALRLAGRYGFRIYDALIVAAAVEAGCDTLYTEDLQAGQVIDGQLVVTNPFPAF